MNMNHEKNHADRGCSSCGCSEAGDSQVISLAAQAPASNNIPLFRIPTMDCAVEEGEIRQLLDKVPGIVGLRFQLGARTLAIDAPQDVVAQALAAIRKAGFKPVPATGNDGPGGGHGGNSCSAHDHGHDHPNGHDHSHGKGLTLPEGLPRYGLALLLALGAESLAYFAPDTLLFKGLGMVLAGVAIALAGLSTYIKGMAALRRPLAICSPSQMPPSVKPSWANLTRGWNGSPVTGLGMTPPTCSTLGNVTFSLLVAAITRMFLLCAV